MRFEKQSGRRMWGSPGTEKNWERGKMGVDGLDAGIVEGQELGSQRRWKAPDWGYGLDF